MQIDLFQDVIKFQPKQMEAWETLILPDTKYFLYGGAAGGGKSYFLRWAAVLLGIFYFSKYKVRAAPIGLFSEDYPTLADRQISRFEKDFPPYLGRLKDDKRMGLHFKLNAAYGGAVVMLRNLDDPSKYASTEFVAELVEELTKNKEETFEDLRFRLRYPGIREVKFVAATNPGEIGHAWVKKLWIAPDPRFPDPEQEKFKFVPAKATDNKYLDDVYQIQLGAFKNPQKVAALRDGSWDIISGQVFAEWRRQTHVVADFEIPKDWHKYMALDWGVNKPFSLGWYAQNQDGRLFKYRELYMNGDGFKSRFDIELTPTRLAKVINEINRANNEFPRYLVADPSIWNQAYFGKGAKALEGGESIAEVMARTLAGVSLVRGDNDRVNGLARFREWLAIAPDGKPWMQFFESCYDSIRTIPALVYSKTQYEDVDTNGDDHAYDEARYLIMSRPTQTPMSSSPISPIRQEMLRRLHGQDDGNFAQFNTDNF